MLVGEEIENKTEIFKDFWHIVVLSVRVHYYMVARPLCLATNTIHLVCQFCLDHLAVEAGDVGDGLVLRADGLAGTSVGAVTETEFVHLGNHVLHTTGSLYTALGKQGELANLR